MSEISPPLRPMMVHELYPTTSTNELREAYASEGKNAEETDKAKEAYRGNESGSRETHRTQHIEENGDVVAYEMKNGNMQTSTTFSAPGASVSWLV